MHVCLYVCGCVCACVCVCSCAHAHVHACVCVRYILCVHMLRRNHPGDKDKALTVMGELLKQQENQVPDFLCLCGRIYKDKFVDSGYSDNESRDKAIYW